MAVWNKTKVNPSTINGGNRYENGQQLSVDAVNAMIESGLYAQEYVENFANQQPVVKTDDGGLAVTLEGTGDYKHFVFHNIKGNKGDTGVTPTLEVTHSIQTNYLDGTPQVQASTNADGTKTTFTFFNLKGPQGPAGLQGPQGDTGPQGPEGPKGEQGKSSVWHTGTSISGTGSGISVSTSTVNAVVGDMYLNKSTYDVYRCVAETGATRAWSWVCNIQGAKGDTGTTPTIRASNGPDVGLVGTPRVTASTVGTVTTFSFDYLKGAKGDTGEQGPIGPQGEQGERGPQGLQGATGASSSWYAGTAISGDTTSSGKVFSSSGILLAQIGDMYLNTDTSNVYRCLNGGPASNALWVYVANIKGATGQQGPIGLTGPQGPSGVGINSITVTRVS